MKFKYLIALFLSLIFVYANAQNIGLIFNETSEKTAFAVKEIESILQEKGIQSVKYDITQPNQKRLEQTLLHLVSMSERGTTETVKKVGIKNTTELKEEGFLIHISEGKKQRNIYIIGKDESGLMYGGLEVAEVIKVQGLDSVNNQLQNPYMKVRGTKYNIPLDMRTPTYTEPSDAAQKNMGEMWSFDFWKEYIDALARNRYNLISLWNMHPFPSMVKVPEYPDVALNDVRRSTGNWKENYSLNGWGFDAPEVMKSFEVLKKMTIEEKIEFWRKVMAYGKQRNVKFYMVTWNIFVYGVDGKYGITDKLENPITVDYFRKSIKQMVLTYPDLAGIGLTTGENMYDYSNVQKEEWAYATYGQGVIDALKEQPDRKIDFIHRQHESKAKEISKTFKDLTLNKNINFLFSFKYAKAHVYSSEKQVFHEEYVKDIQSENYKTLWTLRNDDVFYFRWGAPDFVRNFIKNIPQDVTEGYYYGSDQYVWGRDFLSKDNPIKGQIELDKHWYQWMCWGRLGYNPNMGNDRFVQVIQARYPSVNATKMFSAWQSASMIYPLVTGFHWGALDFQWYIESGQSQPSVSKTPSGYHDINNFINLQVHKGTENITIPDYVKSVTSNIKSKGITPLQVADSIQVNTDNALSWAENQKIDATTELRITIEDIMTMAYLGKYYAHKIKAATYLALFRETLKKEWQTKSIEELNKSAGYWRHYTSLGISNNHNPLWTNRVGHVNWKENFKWSIYEVIANGGVINLPPMKPTSGGTILEAEETSDNEALVETKFYGFTGKGYIGSGDGHHARQTFKWTYNASESGKYILEFRYSLNRDDVYPMPLIINDKKVDDVQFWSSGGQGNWVWDRVTVNLEKGSNTIAISPEKFVLLDHLNIIKK